MEAMPLIRSKVGRGLPLLEGLCFPTDKGVYCRRRGRSRRLWCVPCPNSPSYRRLRSPLNLSEFVDG